MAAVPSTRRQFLQTTVAAGAAMLAAQHTGLAIPTTGPARRPNLILFLTDDQRADSLGCAGHPILKTPHIDALAQQGVRFTEAFATSAICVVSRATILTGLMPQTHGVHDFSTPLDPVQWQHSYPMLLRKAGYRTGFIGKWGIDGGPLPVGDYDSFVGYSGQGRYYEPGSSKHLTARQAEQAVAFLQTCKADEPFALQVSFKAPHVQDEGRHLPGIYAKYPYDPAYLWMYDDAQTKPVITKDRQPLPAFFDKSMNRTREGPDFEPAVYQETLQDLYRLLTGVDDAVGSVVDCVNRLGFDRDTVIIYASDHGSFYGEHGFGGKWLMHEESIRSPLIISDPRYPAAVRGSTRQQTVLNVDLPATLLDLAGIAIPPTMQGNSLLPIIQEKVNHWRTEWFYQQTFANVPTEPIIPCEGVRTSDWKYIRYINTPDQYEQLFDLKNDPREENNLAADPASQTVLDTLRASWKQWKEILPKRAATAGAKR